ncbi:hypothetical protein [Clostridium scatologenes]|uniref:Uncharacterized protein n=1 Tax=Clostridium scatologenes TaxID=1548 RepID=A0A0E3M5L7_CLOSL|nr:hypothetical protein [Clostridium scatologenes]AKA68597.1 hypothetical protein CSCA_1472 [Clostridium scatologenes]
MSSKNDNQDTKKDIVKEENKQNIDEDNLNRNSPEENSPTQSFYCPYMNYCSMMQDQSMFMYPREDDEYDDESDSQLEGYRHRHRRHCCNCCYPYFGCYPYYQCYPYYPCWYCW